MCSRRDGSEHSRLVAERPLARAGASVFAALRDRSAFSAVLCGPACREQTRTPDPEPQCFGGFRQQSRRAPKVLDLRLSSGRQAQIGFPEPFSQSLRSFCGLNSALMPSAYRWRALKTDRRNAGPSVWRSHNTTRAWSRRSSSSRPCKRRPTRRQQWSVSQLRRRELRAAAAAPRVRIGKASDRRRHDVRGERPGSSEQGLSSTSQSIAQRSSYRDFAYDSR
jgi:hypothetical protein